MTRFPWQFGIIALCWLLGGIALPCPAGAQTTLVVWHSYRGQEKTAFEKVTEEFNKAMAGRKISVTTLAVPYDAYADKITASIPRGKGPDVFIFAQDRLGGWIEAGNTVEPIGFYLDDAVRKRFIESTTRAMTYRGSVYGLPFNYKTLALIYNKALVKNPPRTSGELVKIAKQFTNPKAGRFGLVYWYSNWYYHAALMNAFGGRAFDPGPKPVLDNPDNIRSIKYLLRLYKQDRILPDDPSTALVTTLFNAGKTPMVFNGPWFLGEIADNIKYGVAMLPTVDEAGGSPMRPWITVEGVYIALPSQHKEEAYEFAAYVTAVPAAKIMAMVGRQLPANKSVYALPEIAGDPVLSAFRKQLDVSVPMPNFAEMTMMWSPVSTAMNKIVKGTASPEAAMAEAQKNIVKNLEGLRKQK
ncbi:MAG: extracellular solute-binding protein [Deltaproteobacteria bacterium]|nr:extracellular solute-binding protein [Deltaproteobacteria bacterium]